MSTATTSLEQLLDTILARPASDRAVITDVVLNSLDPPDPEVEQEILKLARLRLADYDAGREEAIPVEDALKEVDEFLKEAKSR